MRTFKIVNLLLLTCVLHACGQIGNHSHKEVNPWIPIVLQITFVFTLYIKDVWKSSRTSGLVSLRVLKLSPNLFKEKRNREQWLCNDEKVKMTLLLLR
jgi:hypothetical protein